MECEATVLNINAGFNQELMEHCRLLYEYSTFVGKVRDYLETHPHDLDEAMDLAVEECIRDGNLTQFLKRHKAKVKTVILEEYDRENILKQRNWKAMSPVVMMATMKGVMKNLKS